MIRKLMINAIRDCNGSEEFAERLLMYGEKGCLAWLANRYVNKRKVYDSLIALSTYLDIPLSKARYAYFSSIRYSKGDLLKKTEFKHMMSILSKYKNDDLCISIMRFAFLSVKKICIEEMLNNDEPILEISERLNTSQSSIYKVRKFYFLRIVKQKGDLL